MGEKIEDPYAIHNMQKAYQSLKEQGKLKSDVELQPNYIYVRFLPRDTKEYNLLSGKYKLELFNFPLDYNIVGDISNFHDPRLSKDKITWQYAVVPIKFNFPSVKHQILHKCYIPEDDNLKSSEMSDFNDLLEYESFLLTGNIDSNFTQLKSSWVTPTGTLKLYKYTSDSSSSMISSPEGLREVKVRAWTVTKISTVYTNSHGQYRMDKSFRFNPRYHIVFKNKIGYCIRGNANIFTSAEHYLGQHSNRGVSRDFFHNSNAWLYASINNCTWWYYKWTCDYFGINKPPNNIVIWAPRVSSDKASANAPMARQIGLSINSLTDLVTIAGAAYFSGGWTLAFAHCSPDIMVFGNPRSSSSVYSTMWHELAHASHYSKVGKTFWLRYIGETIDYGIRGLRGYGYSSTRTYVGVGELWGYFFETRCIKAYWGGSPGLRGTNYWFKPQIFDELYYNHNFTIAQLFSCLSSSTTSHAQLKQVLINNYDKDEQVRDVFEEYGF